MCIDILASFVARFNKYIALPAQRKSFKAISTKLDSILSDAPAYETLFSLDEALHIIAVTSIDEFVDGIAEHVDSVISQNPEMNRFSFPTTEVREQFKETTKRVQIKIINAIGKQIKQGCILKTSI